MRIQKAIFSVTEPAHYSSYWNIQSKLYKLGLGIEPICLLYGKKANTDMSEEYGKVIEMDILPDIPWVIQMTLSKFYWPTKEPETVWIVGDMDLLPLQKNHFIDKIAPFPDDHYLHLNNAGISLPRCGNYDGFVKQGSEVHGRDRGTIGTDLPAHYHVGKGYHFNNLYFQNRSFEEVLRYIVDSNRYGMGIGSKFPIEKKTEVLPPFSGCGQYWWYWLAEENYTSEQLYNAIQNNTIFYDGLNYNNDAARIWRWNKEANNYDYNSQLLSMKAVVDIHCCQVRPYNLQAEALDRIIELSGILK